MGVHSHWHANSRRQYDQESSSAYDESDVSSSDDESHNESHDESEGERRALVLILPRRLLRTGHTYPTFLIRDIVPTLA